MSTSHSDEVYPIPCLRSAVIPGVEMAFFQIVGGFTGTLPHTFDSADEGGVRFTVVVLFKSSDVFEDEDSGQCGLNVLNDFVNHLSSSLRVIYACSVAQAGVGLTRESCYVDIRVDGVATCPCQDVTVTSGGLCIVLADTSSVIVDFAEEFHL